MLLHGFALAYGVPFNMSKGTSGEEMITVADLLFWSK